MSNCPGGVSRRNGLIMQIQANQSKPELVHYDTKTLCHCDSLPLSLEPDASFHWFLVGGQALSFRDLRCAIPCPSASPSEPGSAGAQLSAELAPFLRP